MLFLALLKELYEADRDKIIDTLLTIHILHGGDVKDIDIPFLQLNITGLIEHI
ncbi:MAG: hypothetical protein H6767_00410 [Candidatus Peribacteria bacterium]|nr:MAG: hypothetical protein H6767_00410 [Candidatus Peribacteria bacterium]